MASHLRALTSICAVAAIGWAVTGCGTGLSAVVGRSSPPLAPAAGSFMLLQEPDAGLTPIRDMISAATKSVKLTIYELADTDTEDTLIASHKRGVKVEVLLDTAFHGGAVNATAYRKLSAAGVDVRWARAETIVHQKSVTIDSTDASSNSRTAIGTGNIVSKHAGTARDFWIVDSDRADVAAVAATFDQDFTGQISRAVPAPHLLWSPGARKAVVARIDETRSKVLVTSEELTDRQVASALQRAAARGVQCRIILPAGANNAGTIADVARAGCQIHHTAADAASLYMHAKILVTDGNSGGDTGDRVLIGSMNLSALSLTENRELALTLDSHTAGPIVAAIESTFDKDFAATAA